MSEARTYDTVCQQINEARRQHLADKYPGAEVVVVGSNRLEDFVRLLRAPVLFRDSQSSFGLWAGVANKGKVRGSWAGH